MKDLFEEGLAYIQQSVQHCYIWIGIITFVVLIVLWRWVVGRTRSIGVSDSTSGHIRISRRALYELVQRASEQLGASTRPSVKFHTVGDKLNFEISLRMGATQQLSDMSARMQYILTKTLRENLGMANLGRIDILIVGFDGTPGYNKTGQVCSLEEHTEQEVSEVGSEQNVEDISHSDDELR